MSDGGGHGPLLELEPLLEAVREGVEAAGWELSGLQKTTSHQFEGRWEGEASRSAYLFFHRPGGWESVSIDVFLDETSRGLQGNLALVVDGPPLEELGPAATALAALAAAAAERLPEGYRTPVTLRLALPDAQTSADQAEVEYRFKLRIPSGALEAGTSAVAALASATVRAFESLLEHPDLRAYAVLE